MRTERSLFCEESLCPERTVHLVGGHLMEALVAHPYGIAVVALSDDPCLASRIEEVLCAEDVHREEELRVFYRAVHMTLGGEVDHIVDVILAEQSVGQLAVAHIAFDEDAALAVDVVFDGTEVAGIGQGIEHDDADVFLLVFLVQQKLDKVGSDEACCSCNEISLHISERF